MTNALHSIPPVCCPSGSDRDLMALFVILGVWIALRILFGILRKKKGTASMKRFKNRVILAFVMLAVVAIFALRQHRQAPPPPPPAQEAATVAAVPQAESLPLLLELGADKCVPCKMMAPILEDLKTTYAGQLRVDFIDVWKNPDAATPYGIRIIPVQIFFNESGQELFRHEGFFAKEDILSKWKELGYDFP